MTRERETPGPYEPGESAKSCGGDKGKDSRVATVATTAAATFPTPDTAPDWGAAMACPMSCGRRHCPWECPQVWGTS